MPEWQPQVAAEVLTAAAHHSELQPLPAPTTTHPATRAGVHREGLRAVVGNFWEIAQKRDVPEEQKGIF